jgi:hypothetical protein
MVLLDEARVEPRGGVVTRVPRLEEEAALIVIEGGVDP